MLAQIVRSQKDGIALSLFYLDNVFFLSQIYASEMMAPTKMDVEYQ